MSGSYLLATFTPAPGITGVRPFLGALDADSAAADALAEVARLERLRDRLGEHGAAVDGRQPEGKLEGKMVP